MNLSTVLFLSYWSRNLSFGARHLWVRHSGTSYRVTLGSPSVCPQDHLSTSLRRPVGRVHDTVWVNKGPVHTVSTEVIAVFIINEL